MRIPLIPRDDRPAGERCEVTLRERGNHSEKPNSSPNLDAVPEARADLPDERPPNAVSANGGTPGAASRDGSGTGDQPAPPCVETDGFSSGSSGGKINRSAERESPRRECGESSLRDVPQLDNSRAAGGPEPSFSEAETDALEFIVEEGRIASIHDYGILRSLLVRLRPEWEHGDDAAESDTTPPRCGAPSGCETVPDHDSRVWETPRTPPPHATPPQGSVQGEGSFLDSRNAKEPVAWAVELNGELEASFCGPAGREDAADWREQSDGVIVPLYRQPQPKLTNEERAAVRYFAGRWDGPVANGYAATLRGLLERLGGER